MGSYVSKKWITNEYGLTRRERQSGEIRTYLPDKIARLEPSLKSSTITEITNAQEALINFGFSSKLLTKTDGVARLLLKAEAIGSSQIEGLTIGPRRLLKAQLNLNSNNLHKDEKAAEIIGNINAMEEALTLAVSQNAISIESILTMHEKLLSGTKMQCFGGAIRNEQNWIGGNSFSPFAAIYIPPAPEYVNDLLEDLIIFCNRTDLPVIMQAAIAHAQFESIHPFIDGNGRTGRALIHLILQKRGICTKFVPPISLILATHSKTYSECLNNYRSDCSEDIELAINNWVEFFSIACSEAVKRSIVFENNAAKLIEGWKKKLDPIRKDSHALRLLDILPGMPIFTANQASSAINVSISNIIPTLNRFEKEGILKQVNAGKRNRVYEAIGAISLYNMFERGLASPTGDTATAKPSRPVTAKNKDA